MSTFKKVFVTESVFKGAGYTTLGISILTVINSLGINISFINKLPFSNLGLNWIIPAILGGIIGKLLFINSYNIKRKISL